MLCQCTVLKVIVLSHSPSYFLGGGDCTIQLPVATNEVTFIASVLASVILSIDHQLYVMADENILVHRG